MATNQRVILVQRPTGPARPECFSLESEPLADLEAGQVRVAVEYLSVDAAIRTMLRSEGFHSQVAIGQTVRAGGVGRVVESRADGWDLGQAVRGQLGAQTLVTTKAG